MRGLPPAMHVCMHTHMTSQVPDQGLLVLSTILDAVWCPIFETEVNANANAICQCWNQFVMLCVVRLQVWARHSSWRHHGGKSLDSV